MKRSGPISRTAGNGARTRGLARSIAVGALVALGLLALALSGEATAQTPPPLPSQPDPLRFIDPTAAATTARSKEFHQKGSFAGPIRKADHASPLLLNADELEYDTKNNRVIARGNVEIFYNENALTADLVIYDQNTNTLTAIGNAKMKQPDGAIAYGERIDLTADFAEAFVQQLSIVGRDDSRIVARRAIRRDGQVTEFEQGKFTACRSDPSRPPLWCVAADRMVHDPAKKTITYQDARFEVFGVPVFYSPFFQHPDPSVKSATGLLMPTIGGSSQLGTIVEVPYHIALAPNYDLLFHPMYMSKYGILYKGDFRHATRIGNAYGMYTVNLAAIDQTSNPPGYGASQSDFRASVDTHGRFSLSSWWKFGWDFTTATDNSFRRFYKLDGLLESDRVNSAFITGLSDRNYFSTYLYKVGGLLQSNTQQTQGQALPVVDYSYIVADPVLGGELSFNGNALSFTQDLTFTDSGGVVRNVGSRMNRVVANVGWRKKIVDPIGQTFTPFLQARGDVINANDTINPYTRQLMDDETAVRAVGTAGLLYSYPFVANAPNATHVVEPIGQVIARQAKVDQRNLPNIDSRSVVHDDINLFEVDKLTGYDRIETGVRANYGLQYTYQANSGGSMRFLAGQSQHLTGDNIYRNPGFDAYGQPLFSLQNGLERRAADYVMGMYLSPFAPFKAAAQARFDERNLSLQRTDVFAHLAYGPLLSEVGYTYSAAPTGIATLGDQQEITAMLGLRVTDNWSVIGRTRYSIDRADPIQNILQLRYADECFVLTTSYIETHVTNAALGLQPDRTLMFRFELKYLGEYKYTTNVLNSAFQTNTHTNPQ